MKPFFEVDEKRILIMLDPPHMLKLVRNSLGRHKQFHSNGKLISWRYIDRLENKRCRDNFLSHKLTKAHIQWQKNPMKVRLAAQTLSRSVSSSIDYLRQEGDVLFSNSEETSKFLLTFNNLFDVFNSKHANSLSEFGRGLSNESALGIFDFLDSVTNYIKSLKIGWKKIVDSRIRVGFIGFLINIATLKIVFAEYIQTGKLDVVFTFYLGQDIGEF